jgi:peroxiredoxin
MMDETPLPPPNFRFPETGDFPTGPEVGDPLPNFTLMDQHGRPVNFEAARNGQRALVVFHRSARW